MLFLAYFTDLPHLHGSEFWQRTVEFHSLIHRIPIARILTAFYAQFQTHFDFKALTIWANISYLTVLYPLFQLVKREQMNAWHGVMLVGLLFAANGNLDNYALIGVLQHTTAIVFLIWLAYWLSHAETRTWGIWLSLAYPLFSTEGLAFIPIVLLLLIYWKDQRWWVYVLAAALVIYGYFWGYAPTPTATSHASTSILLAIKGAMMIAGGAIKKHVLIASLMGFIFGVHVLWICWCYHQTKKSIYLFMALILMQIMAVGSMIALGRVNESGDLRVLFSERFSTYGTVYLAITYLALTQSALYRIKWNTNWLLIPALVWIGLSHYYAIPKLQNLHTRLLADASNAYHFNLNTSYEFGKREQFLLKSAGKYHFPNAILPISAKPTPGIRLKALATYEPKIREYRIDQKGVLLVFASNKPVYFLAINSLSHSVKLKKDVPYDERTSSLALIP